jgi:hypothetical protein
MARLLYFFSTKGSNSIVNEATSWSILITSRIAFTRTP